MKNKKRNCIADFFKPKVWKGVLTLIAVTIFYLFLSVKIVDYSFDTGSSLRITPIIGKYYSYVLVIFSVAFFYSFFSFIEWLINKRRGE